MPESNRPAISAAAAENGLRSSCAAADYGDAAAEYEALVHGAAVVDLGCRTRLELTGDDRASFLHNLCTNEIRKLTAGSGCEAFLLNVQGRILGHVLIFCRERSLLLETVSGAAQSLANHLEHYHIREAVEIHDRGESWGELFLAGPRAEQLIVRLIDVTPPTLHLSGIDREVSGDWFSLWRIDLGSLQGFLIFYPASKRSSLWELFVSAGARPCGSSALETARIEAGWPLYGEDISERNLPQEVNRDQQTISFVKGCYLGQETVARIDALGHVNKRLVRLKVDSREVPSRGMPLSRGGAVVGEITSACFSPRLHAPLALAYVRCGVDTPGSRLESAAGPCQVVPSGEATE